MRRQRGFTIAEVLTVLVIVGLMLGAIAFSIPLFLHGPSEAQSQVDNVNTAALALYKMQHDARPSNINGVFSCTTSPTIACSTPTPGPVGSPLPAAQAVVILTADGTGQFKFDTNGNPIWTGFIVYWLTPNADGSSNELRRAYYPIPETLPVPLADPVTALTTVIGAPGYETVAQDVVSMSAAIDFSMKTVDLQIDGGDKTGNKSSLSLAGNSYARN